MYKFYAFLSRMKYINRWSLMRNTRTESVAEHTFETAVLAHALASIEKNIFKEDINPEKCAAYALFHETAEVITGDLPTPVKYFNPEMKKAFSKVEKYAEDKILKTLPQELKDELESVVRPQEGKEKQLVKVADKLAGLIKCIEELTGNNDEFLDAYDSLLKQLETYNCRSLKYFLDNFLNPFYMSLDELSKD